MVKRNRLEIIQEILRIIQNSHEIRPTPLLRRSNLSTTRFKEYYKELLEKEFIIEKGEKSNRFITLSEKGRRFLEKYTTIVNFIDEFDL